MPDTTLKDAKKQLSALGNIGVAQKQQFIAGVLTEKPDTLYSPGDYGAIRTLIYNNVAKAIQRRFPLRNQKYTLGIQNVAYADPQHIPLSQQKKAILQNKSLGRRLQGSWVLKDTATDKVIAKTGKMTLMSVPYMTDRGTFIRSGSQYTFNNIMRLQPGVYTKRNNDDQLSAQFNVKRGTGAGFNMRFVPSSGLFYITKGTKNVPAYTILNSMGVTDDVMKDTWGQQLFQKNKQAGTSQRALNAANTLYGEK